MAEDDALVTLGAWPSTGMVHWGVAVRTQLDRVRATRDAQRNLLRGDPAEASHPRHRNAALALHFDTHFLVIAIRNVLRFHDAIAARLDDERLRAARERFDRRGPGIARLRNFYEHLDRYAVGEGIEQKKNNLYTPTGPVLDMSGDDDTLVVCFGPLRFEVIEAGEAAFELAEVTARVRFEAVNPYRAAQRPLTI